MNEIKICANRLAAFLNKPPELFTKKDLINCIKTNGIKMVNFRHVAGDGRLKTLNFTVTGEQYLDRILSAGERVDGSSLFKDIDPSSSDLYVMPRYRTAFINPFSVVPALEILCSFYTPDGRPFINAPAEILRRAESEFTKTSGFDLHALGELEYYVMAPRNPLYPMNAQRGYHESHPFAKWEGLRAEAMCAISEAGGKIKYGHSEVGFIRTEDSEMSQQEIEFLPSPANEAADQLAVGKWILSSMGHKYGVSLSFAPKIYIGHAGSGLHFHTALFKNGRNCMIERGGLSPHSKKLIAGFLSHAKSLTAFGNTVPTSYFRLVPHQEAPINICWGYHNRSALVRIPLGWLKTGDMIRHANPLAAKNSADVEHNQTVEFRSADGSANVHLFLAGLCVAARRGFEMKDPLGYARRFFVDRNLSGPARSGSVDPIAQLPSSCFDSALELEKARGSYEAKGVFGSSVIDGIIKRLKGYGDRNLSERLYGKEDEIKKIVDEFLYC